VKRDIMTKSAFGAVVLIGVAAVPGRAQEAAQCEPAATPTSELVVWRGSARSVSEVPTVRPEAACEVDQEMAASEELAVSDEGLIVGEALGIPDLTEIEALVLASPGIREAAAASSGEDVPEVIERTAPSGVRGHGVRAVFHDSAMGDAPHSMIHLIVRDASPEHLEVAVQPMNGAEVTLRWTRSVQDPTWSPVTEVAAS
jgi:hypothetical protein